jgi:putative PEP-CTERM system histidine kinase
VSLGYFSYLAAAIAFGLLSILLLFYWRKSNRQGKFFTFAIVVNAIWAGSAAQIANDFTFQIGAYQVLEIVRNIAWFVFLLKLFDSAAEKNVGYRKYVRWALPVSVGISCLLLADEYFSASLYEYVPSLNPHALGVVGHVVLALMGLAILEQLFRNTSHRNRWSIKFLFVSVGGIFAIDFYMYSEALLFREIDLEVWSLRGIINLAAVPLLAVSAARNKDWSLNIFVSRDIVLNTTAILGGGVYLLVMAAAGYYLREHGGEWGRVGQVVFFSMAIALLVAVMLSGQLRSKVSVFIAKHFYKNKYDYRYEWLRLTNDLSATDERGDRYKAAVQVLARIVEARGGMIWLCDEQNRYSNEAAYNNDCIKEITKRDDSLVLFLEDTGYVINVAELETQSDEYQGLILPAWLKALPQAWLIVPLFSPEKLIGFVVLMNPLVKRTINWEDRDLLKAAAKQISSYLVILMMSEELSRAKQFEVFNRLSAYMTHDLKNIAAELELVSRNSDKHRDNPDFINDAFDTVTNATKSINRLLSQLRNKNIQPEKKITLNLRDVAQAAVAKKQGQLPMPILEECSENYFAVAENDRLINVMTHLIDNAQQATDDAGRVHISLASNGDMHNIVIQDNGHGMDEDFIRNRLFKPFDTSKGNAGMGIGMYESQEFITQLGGHIHVESTPGVGTSVTLHIPVATPL